MSVLFWAVLVAELVSGFTVGVGVKQSSFYSVSIESGLVVVTPENHA